MSNRTKIITLKLSREYERKIRNKAINDNISIVEYIKKVCIYDPWLEIYKE